MEASPTAVFIPCVPVSSVSSLFSTSDNGFMCDKVEATADGGYAIGTNGNVEVNGSAQVIATTGEAISANGNVTVSGGEVSATTGTAIFA